jgi:hypothetical protein
MKIDKNDKKELIAVSIYILVIILTRFGIDFFSIFSLILFPIIIGYLIYLEFKRGSFKSNNTMSQVLWAVFALYYKTNLVTALYFQLHKFPGAFAITIFALSITLLYLILMYFTKKNKNLSLTSLIYLLVFGIIIFAI